VRQQLGSKQNWSDSDDLCVMFKGAYTDTFYRAVRDALHAEVDSWKPAAGAVQVEQFDGEQVWTQVELLEPASRNPDATELPELETASAYSGSQPRSTFVPVRRLAASAGEA
jgi:hypothetical protein